MSSNQEVQGLVEDGAEDPDRRHGNHDQEQREAEDVSYAMRLYAGSGLGFVEVNFIAVTFHRRLLAIVTWSDGDGAI